MPLKSTFFKILLFSSELFLGCDAEQLKVNACNGLFTVT